MLDFIMKPKQKIIKKSRVNIININIAEVIEIELSSVATTATSVALTGIRIATGIIFATDTICCSLSKPSILKHEEKS